MKFFAALFAVVAVWIMAMIVVLVYRRSDCESVGGEPTVTPTLEWGCVKKPERIEMPKPVRKMT